MPVPNLSSVKLSEAPSYKAGDKVATRQDCGFASAKIGCSDNHVVTFNGDTKNSTISDISRKEFPDQFGECFIDMVGLDIDVDGQAQMAVEVMTMLRAISTATILHPSDVVSTERAVELATQAKGIIFIRTSRPATSNTCVTEEQF